eukprot:COSAG02_NODE_169_length_31557_cov_25.092473_26_plen_1129_part_00
MVQFASHTAGRLHAVAARPPACDERKGIIRKKVLGLYTAWFTGEDDTARREIAAIEKPTAKYDRFHKENAEAMGELEHGYENLRRDMGQAIGKYHAANPVRAVAAVDTAATASTGRAALIVGDDQNMQIDNGITAAGATTNAAKPVRAVAAVDSATTASTGRAALIVGDDQNMQIDNGITAAGATTNAAKPVRAVAAVDSAATASTGRATLIVGDDQDMQIDNGIMPSTAVGATAEDDVSVLMCLNQMLKYYHTSNFSNSHPATRDELDKHHADLQDTVGHDGTLARDHNAVCLLLRDRFGDGNYEFYATDPAEILRADQTDGRFLLVHGCLERAKDAVARWSHYDDLEGVDHNQLVTEWPEEYDDQYDGQHMHTILIPPGKRGMDKRFYCHRLEAEWGTRGASINHLGLRDDGQPECRGYYMKSISRVYMICVTEDVDSDDEDFDPRAHRPDQEEQIEVSHATEDHPLGNIVPGGRCTRQGTLFNRGTPDHRADLYDLTESDSGSSSDFSDDDAFPEIISDGKQRMLSTPVQIDDASAEIAILPDLATNGSRGVTLTKHPYQLQYRTNSEAHLQDFRNLVDLDTSAVFRRVCGETECPIGPTPRLLGRLFYMRTAPAQEFTNFYQWRERYDTTNRGSRNWTLVELLTTSTDAEREVARTKKLSYIIDYANKKSLPPLKAMKDLTAARYVTQHKAYIAKTLCDIFEPISVLDASGGWGDRLTGFMASATVQNITLIEPRKSACTAFRKQYDDVNCSKILKILNGSAETMLSHVQGPVDLCFTSPPYWPSEEYSNVDGGQVHDTCSTAKEYLENFLIPTLSAQASLLSARGVLAININDVKRETPVCQRMLDAMEKRTDIVFASTILIQFSGKKREPLYVWCRPDYLPELQRRLGIVPAETTLEDGIVPAETTLEDKLLTELRSIDKTWPYDHRSTRGENTEKYKIRAIGLGLVNYQGANISVDTQRGTYAGVLAATTELIHARLPGFVFTGIHISKDGKYPVHCDKGNAGQSAMITLGDTRPDSTYGTCGELFYADSEIGKFDLLDARGKMKVFDGQRAHCIRGPAARQHPHNQFSRAGGQRGGAPSRKVSRGHLDAICHVRRNNGATTRPWDKTEGATWSCRARCAT